MRHPSMGKAVSNGPSSDLVSCCRVAAELGSIAFRVAVAAHSQAMRNLKELGPNSNRWGCMVP
jgi:hypothetical protein